MGRRAESDLGKAVAGKSLHNLFIYLTKHLKTRNLHRQIDQKNNWTFFLHAKIKQNLFS